jgi:hypothetical protein
MNLCIWTCHAGRGTSQLRMNTQVVRVSPTAACIAYRLFISETQARPQTELIAEGLEVCWGWRM